MPVIQVIPSGDLKLVGRQLVLTSGGDLVRQKLACRLKFFLGEWFLDQRLGVPYFQQVLVKNPNSPAITSMFRSVIVHTPGVGSVQSMRLALDTAARRLSFDFVARLSTGTPLVVRPEDEDFIVRI